MQPKKIFQITIDGPVGAGKSTVAKRVAEKLHILYIDTGAMYRALALGAKKKGVAWTNEVKVTELAEELEIELKPPTGEQKDGRNVTVLMEGKDVSWEIREVELGEGASIVSQYPKVRTILVNMQQKLAEGQSIVMEGRDIGTRVLPDAQLKIYMDADIEERVMRKISQLKSMGVDGDHEETRRGIVTRDNREMTRKVDPLRPADDAWMLDTTNLSITEVVDRIVSKVKLI